MINLMISERSDGFRIVMNDGFTVIECGRDGEVRRVSGIFEILDKGIGD